MDLAATLTQVNFGTSAADQQRLRNLAAAIASIRIDLINQRIPDPIQFQDQANPARRSAVTAAKWRIRYAYPSGVRGFPARWMGSPFS